MSDSLPKSVVNPLARSTGQKEGHLMKHDERMSARIANDFAFHAADAERGKRHGDVRSGCHDLAEYLGTLCPPGRELSIALTKLEEVMMWANAVIAREPANGGESC
jgi:hypothetical protein